MVVLIVLLHQRLVQEIVPTQVKSPVPLAPTNADDPKPSEIKKKKKAKKAEPPAKRPKFGKFPFYFI